MSDSYVVFFTIPRTAASVLAAHASSRYNSRMWRVITITLLTLALLPAHLTSRDSALTSLHFRDVSGFYTFNCGTDVAVGATLNLCHPPGHVIGVYLDDTTPNLGHWVTLARVRYHVVLVGQAPGGFCRVRVMCLREWYPYDCRYPAGAWGPLPRARGYILQWRFAWPGCRPPTREQRLHLLNLVRSRHSRIIFTY